MITKKVILKRQRQRVKFMLSHNQTALLMPIGDIHFGAEDFPLNHFKQHIKWGVDRGAYFIGMGDFLDMASTSQRGLIGLLRESTRMQLDDTVRSQADDLIKILKNTKDRWIGMIRGNHTWNFSNGRNVEQYICSALGTGCDYLGDMAMLRISCEDNPKDHPEGDLIVAVHHGKGGGTTIGGHLLKPEQLLKWTTADVILMGHSHAKIVGSIDRIFVTPDGKTSHRTILVARTGAFLRAYAGKEPFDLDAPAYLSSGSYVETGALMPTTLGGICLGIGVEKISGSDYYKPCVHYSV